MSYADDHGRGGARDDLARDRELPPPRLMDGPDPSPGSAEALVVAFLRAANPYRTPTGRRQRLHAALAGARRARRPVRSLLKPALALGLLVCAAATVSAHLLDWPRWLAERLPGREPPAGRPTALAPSAPQTGGASLLPAPRTVEPVAEPLVVPSSPPAAEAAPETRSPPRRTRRHRTIAESAPTAPPTPAEAEPRPLAPPPPEAAKAARRDTAEEDAALALAALTALRRDHDPVRARAMVEAYVRAHPDGSMAEEALAISIEAAAAHHDADAKTLAARYLALYPSGTFRALARKVLSSEGRPSP